MNVYRVIVAVDQDEARADRQAEFVSTLPGSPDEIAVTVVHAVEDRTGSRELQKPDRIRTVRRVAQQLAEQGFDVTEEDAREDPVEGILAVADDIDADLLVLGGRKRSPTGKAIFGSVVQKVILSTTRPVVVTGE